MLSKIILVSALAILAEARFGQEQIPIPAIQAVQGGSPGEADTIAGAAISDLLAATNPCDKLARGDQILADLGTSAAAVAAAIGMVAAEKNFNPFTASIPVICDDPSLPSNAVLRGITPLIDPAVGGSTLANQLSATSQKTPFDATGLSVAGVLKAQGFSNFTVATADSSVAAIEPSGGATVASATSAAASTASSAAASVAAAANANVGTCPAPAVSSSAAVATTSTTSSAASTATSVQGTPGKSTIAGADFGLCTPTMKFEGGINGRPANEFTFLPIDALVAQGQQEALNPNIITNRICDQLTNVCESNQQAKDVCATAQTAIENLGTRDKSTADAWNSMLGFAGTVTNPDGGPAEPSATATSGKRAMRRGVRNM